jgi:L-aspartate oxidase
MGMRFDEGDASALEGGHSARRVHHAGGDRSGRALHRFLEEVVERHGGIVRVDARAVAVELRDGVAAGVRVEGGALIAAGRVVLAPAAPAASTGDGPAPTHRLARGSRSRGTRARRSPTWNSSSSTRRRWTCRGTRAAADRGAPRRGSSAPRRLGRAVHGPVPPAGRPGAARRRGSCRAPGARGDRTAGLLDATSVANVATRFPTAEEQCREVGLDIATTPSRSPPRRTTAWAACSPTCGDEPPCRVCSPRARSPAPGYTARNRLASNSLAEALVFGRRSAIAGRRRRACGGARR